MSRALELKRLVYLGDKPPPEANIGRPRDVLVGDVIVLSPLEFVIDDRDCLAVDVSHEAGILAAMLVVQLDQSATELGLENWAQR